VAYIASLNGLVPGKFTLYQSDKCIKSIKKKPKNSFTLLTHALRMILFARYPEESGKDKGSRSEKCPSKDDENDGCFHTSPRNILKEIKDNPMLRPSMPIKPLAKLKDKTNYCEYPEDFRHSTSKYRKHKTFSMNWLTEGN